MAAPGVRPQALNGMFLRSSGELREVQAVEAKTVTGAAIVAGGHCPLVALCCTDGVVRAHVCQGRGCGGIVIRGWDLELRSWCSGV